MQINADAIQTLTSVYTFFMMHLKVYVFVIVIHYHKFSRCRIKRVAEKQEICII